jgi:Uma2 family endonuclease
MTAAVPKNITLQEFLKLSYIEESPAWVIEILSPNQSQTKVTGNILHCLRHGSQLGWLIDPNERSVLVYHCDRLPDLLTGTELLPVLEEVELNLSVEQMFGWLRRSS